MVWLYWLLILFISCIDRFFKIMAIWPSIASQCRWRRSPHSMICLACLCIQSIVTFPLKSIQWSIVLVSTWRGISWIIPNWQMTRSGVCFSTRWKHTSGTVADHTASLQRTTAEGPLIQLHTVATPPTTTKKQVGNTLDNNVYISKFTKHISCS